jgi:hypothetical protein
MLFFAAAVRLDLLFLAGLKKFVRKWQSSSRRDRARMRQCSSTMPRMTQPWPWMRFDGWAVLAILLDCRRQMVLERRIPQNSGFARDDGRYANDPLKSWFDDLTSSSGKCCSFADGFSVRRRSVRLRELQIVMPSMRSATRRDH